MKFKIGDKVVLNPDSRFANDRDDNPVGVVGTVVEYKTYGLPLRVKWGGNSKNSYDEADLLHATKLDKLLTSHENGDEK